MAVDKQNFVKPISGDFFTKFFKHMILKLGRKRYRAKLMLDLRDNAERQIGKNHNL